MRRIGRSDQHISRFLHHRLRSLEKGEPISLPIVSASKFYLPGDTDAPFQYGRSGSPTWEAVESKIEVLDEAPSLLFASGMAALSALFFATLKSGDTVVVPEDGYFATRKLLDEFIAPLGIRVIMVPTAKLSQAPMDAVDLVLVETPSNPGLDVCDLNEVVSRAHSAGSLVAVDNTTVTSMLQRPFDFGADIVVSSDTKSMSGHSDIVLGHLSTVDGDIYERAKAWRTLAGGIPAPFEAWLLDRGLATLEIRLERMCSSAQAIAARLANDQRIQSVRYPGLPHDPSHSLALRQMSHFGFLIGLTLKDEDAAEAFLSASHGIINSTSFGGVHTSAERRARWGEPVDAGFVRLSVGIEPMESVWAAIEAGLSA
ncbi:MAG: cystathionine gamma-lyase [Myxococcota bacterium]